MRRTTSSASRLLTVLLLAALPQAHTQTTPLPSKRGLAYLGDTHASDNTLLLSPNSSLSWYYNWSPNPVSTLSSLPFLPLLHGLDDVSSSTADTLSTLPSTSTHLLAFNEPDGTTSSGGSAISPSDAAQAYIQYLVPLREQGWNISHPATTGSTSGLDWLQKFNASCWSIAPDTGCVADFVALHWYGDFAGLAGWLGTLREFYHTNASSGAVSDDIAYWITEMALPQGSEDETVAMLNQSMNYLDGLEYVAGYAWFGTDRKSSEWDGYTGGKVAVFNGDGKLTDVGALYLGGKEEGFKAGMSGGVGKLGVSGVATVIAIVVGAGLNMW